MERDQEIFINEKLNSIEICVEEEISKFTNDIYNISLNTITNILKKHYMNGSDMKALFCLFSTLILSNKTSKELSGLYRFGIGIQNSIKKIKQIDIHSKHAYVFNTEFFGDNFEVVIKTPHQIIHNSNILREYLLGVLCFNKLRYLIPTFVYTLGAFECNIENKGKINLCSTGDNMGYIIYEKIKGYSVSQLFYDKKINFKRWLEIFAQLLLTLEVAQRKCRFTHFDLHLGNVMVRENPTDSYCINLDNITYKISPQNDPVIIDFGMSCVYTSDRYIGAYGYENNGVCNFMVPGFDMYKFLIFSLYTAKGKLKNKIIKLLKFYGDNDPYNISKDIKNIKIARNDLCKQITYSLAGTYTPYMFYLWLSKEYNGLISPIISSSKRKEYMILQYSSSLHKYNNIFKKDENEKICAIELANDYIINIHSYILISYNLMILSKYNDKLRSKDLNVKIDMIKRKIDSIKHSLIESDKSVLEKVFDIFHPDEKDLHNACNNVLKLGIRHRNPGEKISTVKILNKLLKYREQLNVYLELFYTIIEINHYELFKEWVDKFLKSDIYTFYEHNNNHVERANRWGMTLLASIHYPCVN